MTGRQRGLAGAFDAQQRQREERDRVGRGVFEPGQSAAQPEGHTTCGRSCSTQVQLPEEEVRGVARHQLEQDVEDNEPQGVLEQKDGWEERCRLHLPGQRRAQTFVGVPPRDMSVEPICRGQMAHRHGDVAGIGVDERKARKGLMASPALQVGVELDRIRRDDMQQAWACSRQGSSGRRWPGERCVCGAQPPKPIPKRDHGAPMVVADGPRPIPIDTVARADRMVVS